MANVGVMIRLSVKKFVLACKKKKAMKAMAKKAATMDVSEKD